MKPGQDVAHALLSRTAEIKTPFPLHPQGPRRCKNERGFARVWQEIPGTLRLAKRFRTIFTTCNTPDLNEQHCTRSCSNKHTQHISLVVTSIAHTRHRCGGAEQVPLSTSAPRYNVTRCGLTTPGAKLLHSVTRPGARNKRPGALQIWSLGACLRADAAHGQGVCATDVCNAAREACARLCRLNSSR
jgi:hypothetical protein